MPGANAERHHLVRRRAHLPVRSRDLLRHPVFSDDVPLPAGHVLVRDDRRVQLRLPRRRRRLSARRTIRDRMTTAKPRVLFVCVHNSARSQMAAALLIQIAGDRFEVESAGLEPGELDPFAVAAMWDAGIDISKTSTESAFNLLNLGRRFHYVISVCDGTSADRIPIFPGASKRLHWSFADPSTFTGSDAERVMKTIELREQIRRAVEKWVEETP
jgi:arsenate reductase